MKNNRIPKRRKAESAMLSTTEFAKVLEARSQNLRAMTEAECTIAEARRDMDAAQKALNDQVLVLVGKRAFIVSGPLADEMRTLCSSNDLEE